MDCHEGEPDKENAFKFLAYISRPGPQAVFAEAISYGPVNNGAYKVILEDVAQILPDAPELVNKQVFQKYAWWSVEAG